MSNILIFGASRGIGASCVRHFCADGDKVAFTYLSSADDAKKLAAECGAVAICCDVRSSEDVRAAAETAISSLGSIDALVCSAGIAHFDLVQDTDDDRLARVIDTDLSGTYRAIRAVVPHMVSRRAGRIVTVASMWGEVGASCESAYSAAKGGVIALTKALAKELGPSGITVNCVSPGVIATDMNSNLSAEVIDALAEESALGRIGTANEVAAAIAFFATGESAFITGQILGVNGGLVI